MQGEGEDGKNTGNTMEGEVMITTVLLSAPDSPPSSARVALFVARERGQEQTCYDTT